MSEWKKCTLKNVLGEKGYIRGPFGSALKRGEMQEDGIPVYEQKNAIYNDRTFRFFIGEDKFKELGRFQVKTNDLIISCSGTVGKISVIKEDDTKGIISQALLILRPDVREIELQFLYYFLSSRQGFELLTQASHGSVQINIAERKVVESIPLLLPTLPEQRAIASVLSSLDDKIDLLHRQNKTLETMAETLFRQWFVEDGSTICNLTDLVEFNPKRQLAKGANAPYLEMANVSTSVFHPENWYYREFSSGTKFNNSDTLIARITPCLENGKSTFVTFLEDGQTGWGSTEFIVMHSKEKYHPFLTYALARNDDFRNYAEGCLEGSSGRQRVNVDHLMNYELYLPENGKIEQFNNVTASIVPKLDKNFRQIKCLEKLRDTLLPKLMSGEVRINP